MLSLRRIFMIAAVSATAATGAAFVATAGNLSAQAATQETSNPSGLRYIDERVGSGSAALTGSTAIVHYTGWLSEDGRKGDKFDSSATAVSRLLSPWAMAGSFPDSRRASVA